MSRKGVFLVTKDRFVVTYEKNGLIVSTYFYCRNTKEEVL